VLYKPWRRQIDKKRARRAHFVPLPQSSDTQVEANEEDLEISPIQTKDGNEINVAPVETTDAAGPAGSSMERR
jgi:high-affinity nickel-transport protein